jgi:hypothetical protein
VLSLALLARVAEASPLLTVSGLLSDPSNSSIVGSLPAPDAPLFGSDFDIANNVAVYAFTGAAAATVSFESKGSAVGDVNPSFTLSMGGSPAVLIFLASDCARALSTSGDFVDSVPRSAGDYFIAMGALGNGSYAEQLDSGTLSDGFVGLGQPSMLGWYSCELAVADYVVTERVPEPATVSLLGLRLMAIARRRALRNRTTWPHPTCPTPSTLASTTLPPSKGDHR